MINPFPFELIQDIEHVIIDALISFALFDTNSTCLCDYMTFEASTVDPSYLSYYDL